MSRTVVAANRVAIRIINFPSQQRGADKEIEVKAIDLILDSIVALPRTTKLSSPAEPKGGTSCLLVARYETSGSSLDLWANAQNAQPDSIPTSLSTHENAHNAEQFKQTVGDQGVKEVQTRRAKVVVSQNCHTDWDGRSNPTVCN